MDLQRQLPPFPSSPPPPPPSQLFVCIDIGHICGIPINHHPRIAIALPFALLNMARTSAVLGRCPNLISASSSSDFVGLTVDRIFYLSSFNWVSSWKCVQNIYNCTRLHTSSPPPPPPPSSSSSSRYDGVSLDITRLASFLTQIWTSPLITKGSKETNYIINRAIETTPSQNRLERQKNII